MEAKYALKPEDIFMDGRRLYRIRALHDMVIGRGSCGFPMFVYAGDWGGYVESMANLSQEGSCWIADTAIVCGDAYVCGNAVVNERAIVKGSAIVEGDAHVSDYTVIQDSARITDATIRGFANIGDNSIVCKHAVVKGEIIVAGHSWIGTTTLNGGIYADAEIPRRKRKKKG